MTKPPLGMVPYLPTHDHPLEQPCHDLCAAHQWARHCLNWGNPYPRIPDETITDALLNAQAELQTALGMYRLDMDANFESSVIDPEYIEMRLAACLSMLHSLMGNLGRPMFKPAKMPEGWTPA